jgi:hypothetical protein
MNSTSASPGGAPWGAANPQSSQNCTACHFDYEAIPDSKSLSIRGLPVAPVTGSTYELQVSFKDTDAIIAGFQMLASAGQFGASQKHIETTGSSIRSTRPVANINGVAWSILWTAQDLADKKVTFYLAVTGANDDGSPLGDRIHFRSFTVTPDKDRANAGR